MKKYTQAQAKEIRGLLDEIIKARDNYHGGDWNRAVDHAKERIAYMDKYERS